MENEAKISKVKILSNLEKIDCTTGNSLIKYYKIFKSIVKYLEATAKDVTGHTLAAFGAEAVKKFEKNSVKILSAADKKTPLSHEEKIQCENAVIAAKTLMSDDFIKLVKPIDEFTNPSYTTPEKTFVSKAQLWQELNNIDCKKLGSVFKATDISSKLTEILINSLNDNRPEDLSSIVEVLNSTPDSLKDLQLTESQQSECLHSVAELKAFHFPEYA